MVAMTEGVDGPQAAMDTLEGFRDQLSTHKRYPYLKAGLLQDLGRHEEAIAFFEEAIGRDPTELLVYVDFFTSLVATRSSRFGY